MDGHAASSGDPSDSDNPWANMDRIDEPISSETIYQRSPETIQQEVDAMSPLITETDSESEGIIGMTYDVHYSGPSPTEEVE